MDEREGLEQRIAEWRSYVRRRQAVHAVDVEELEDHLRSQVESLGAAGLNADEAFLVAVKRLGDLDSLSREFAREYSERLWKQLVVGPATVDAAPAQSHDAVRAVLLAIGAAIAIRLPEAFGWRLGGPAPAESFYLHNAALLVLPWLAVYFSRKRGLRPSDWLGWSLPIVVAAVVMNVTPFRPAGSTEVLAVLHLPIVLWLTTGIAYASGRWRDHAQRMNYVRFTGEWFIYYALIAAGGGVLMGFTMFLFQAIGLNAEQAVATWVLPAGAAGAVLIAAWLVESKQSVVENMAPVLTLLFTPLFAILLLFFVGTMLWTGNALDVGRELLIGFDLLLVLVLALLLYAISARDPQAPPRWFDRLQLALVVCALLVDVMALWAIAARILEFGFSPNKVAALGENLILLVNLGVSAVLYVRFLGGKATFTELERWQTSYVPVYLIWAWIVVAIFPVVFGFR
ncbi:MAG: hypothetical protein KC591_12780 [Gemmatimonadetes bacterium]|nr:hypothetical protein [Gemmatimonadota bacterium]